VYRPALLPHLPLNVACVVCSKLVLVAHESCFGFGYWGFGDYLDFVFYAAE
jgi:hypothetical protein